MDPRTLKMGVASLYETCPDVNKMYKIVSIILITLALEILDEYKVLPGNDRR
jgi:hypothetical protein